MSQLLDLPNEVLDKIVDQIHPDDIINFSLCRKEIHHLAKDAVSLHLHRERLYKIVTLHGCHRHENNSHPLRLIRDICMDWRTGEYTKLLVFQCCHHPNRPGDAIDHEDVEDTKRFEIEKSKDDAICQKTMQDIQGYIEEKFRESGFSTLNRTYVGTFDPEDERDRSSFDVREACIAAKEGNRDAMLALLLFLIPNIEGICLAQSTRGNFFQEEAINSICFQDQNLQRSPSARKPLMKLSLVRFLGYDKDILYANDEGENFERFLPFAALSSMRTIVGDFVKGQDTARSVRLFPPHTSNVNQIELRRSAVKAEYLAKLMAGVKALKGFYYDYNENLDGGGAMEIHKIIGTLLEHAKDSLEMLGITGRCDLRNGEGDIHPCRGSLRDFEVLKKVMLNSYVYVEHASDDDSVYNPDEISHAENHGLIIRHLVDVLPPSIEVIQLVGVDVLKHAEGLLGNLFEQKQLRLPKLRELIIRANQYYPGSGWEKGLRERCEKVGVALTM